MKKEFVPYSVSLKLKAIGFDEPCLGLYYDNGKTNEFANVSKKGKMTFLHNSDEPWRVTRVLYQQAFRWFREKYSWQHSIEPTKDQHCFELGYNYWIWNHITGEEHHTMPKNRPSGDWEYETYEKAELACLDRLIEIVESKIKNNESNITKN